MVWPRYHGQTVDSRLEQVKVADNICVRKLQVVYESFSGLNHHHYLLIRRVPFNQAFVLKKPAI